MTIFEKVMLGIFTFLCIVGFAPAVRNFLVVLRDNKNSKVTAWGRRLLLAYLALGVVCIILGFIFCIYSLIIRW